MTRLAYVLAPTLALTYACSAPDDGGYTPPPCQGYVPASAAATVPYVEIDREGCRYMDRCVPTAMLLYENQDLSSCVSYKECTAHEPAEWTVTHECIEAIRAFPCEGVHWSDFISIQFQNICAVGGPLPLATAGEACGHTVCRGDGIPPTRVACGEGLSCIDSVCQPITGPSAGEACTMSVAPGVKVDPCVGDSYCQLEPQPFDEDTVSGVCRPEPNYEEPCQLVDVPGYTSDPCPSDSSCVNGTCTAAPAPMWDPRPTRGEACEPGHETCRFGLTCVAGTCEAIDCTGDEGSRCDRYSCEDGLVCNSRTLRCEPRGESCDEAWGEYCEAGEFCDDYSFSCQSAS